MTTISAKSILRTRSAEGGPTLSTLLLRYPKWIHAEGRTHRLIEIAEDCWMEVRTPSLMECDDLSRNAASSRAIPINKMIQDVLDDPAVPLFWGKNVAGMQASEELTGEDFELAKKAWNSAMHAAIDHARWLAAIGAHKQIANRVLEPYSHITVLATATDWNNFLALRDHPDAEPHIHKLASAVRSELENAPVQVLEPGYWHLPFVTSDDIANLAGSTFTVGQRTIPLTVKKSVACCASTSYKTVDGFEMSLERATALHDRLLSSSPLHASPAEHVAQVDEIMMNGPYQVGWRHQAEHGNLRGFRQYRKMLPNEALPG